MNISELPLGKHPAALDLPHFAARWQAVVWRNWNMIPVEKLAAVLRTSPDKIIAGARAMGLPEPCAGLLEEWKKNGYISLVRRNWDLLPYDQLLDLLDWTPDRMMFTLRFDDFLWSKVGFLKPDCPEAVYHDLTPEEEARTRKTAEIVRRSLAGLPPAAEPLFAFRKQFGARQKASSPSDNSFDLRMVYPYCAVYGDFLLESSNDIFSDELLDDYAASGVNAFWLQGILCKLVPWMGEDEECSRGWQIRLETLRKLTARLKKRGFRIFLYINEPRGMPEEFFSRHPTWRGGAESSIIDSIALCTSRPEVRDALRDGLTRLFTEVPDLGGVFAITMSENLTNCYSKFETHCPRCLNRRISEVVAEVCNTIEEGVHRASPEAEVIIWDWGWKDWAEETVPLLSRNVTFMATSETGLETECGGVRGMVVDYSISKPGPGERAKRLWAAARKRGLKLAAKIQVNNTWEMSAVPWLPVPGLVEEHLDGLKQAGITGIMASWTLGGFPGGNLELMVRRKEEIAGEFFGEGAEAMLLAGRQLGDAFRWFPFNSSAMIYNGPQNTGAMNLLYEKPTGRSATMVCYPYDDLDRWRGTEHPVEPYPPEAVEEAFRKMSEGLGQGMRTMEAAAEKIPPHGQARYRELLGFTRTFYCHFRSSYLQICWIRRHSGSRGPAPREILKEEIELARLQIQEQRRDSRIGYEASNHYYYTENDLLEKILNCEQLLESLED